MKKRIAPTSAALLLAACASVASPIAAAREQDFSGDWVVISKSTQGTASAVLQLERTGDTYVGRSGPLDTLAACPLAYAGAVAQRQLRLTAQCRDREIGVLDLTPRGTGLAGSGKLFNVAVTVSAERPAQAARAPRTHQYDPTEFHPVTSSMPAPVLRLISGDRVQTRTVDAYGLDESGASVSMPGNPGVGPFYVEGAMPGDTLAIRFISLKTNRPMARMNTALDPAAVMPGHTQNPGAVKDPIWLLDPAENTASLRTPSEKLQGFKAPLRPMLGVVSVAPAGFSVANRELGEWGGNLDYNEMRAGATLYLPVFQVGGLLYVGDGHALQGAGEITGQGLETSLAIEFEVELIKGETLPRRPGFPPLGPWAENADYILVSGIGGDVTDALRRATTGLSLWLQRAYALDDSEVAAVLGTSVEYDVAAVISAKSHVVAKIRKDILKQIGAPAQR